MREVIVELFKHDVNWPRISPSNYIGTEHNTTRAERHSMAKNLRKNGFDIRLMSVGHNDQHITLNYMIFDKRRK